VTPAKTPVVSALGDSITAGTPLWDPDPAVQEMIGSRLDPQSQWIYWAERAHPEIEFRNFGVNREETGQIGARLDEAAEGADVVVVQGGINDIVHGKSIERGAENLRAIVSRGRALGKRVLLTNVLPCNGFPEAEESIRAFNRLIEQISRDERVTLLPFYDTLEDLDRPGRIGPAWTDDGNHPSIAGHRLLGELAFSLPSDPGE